MQTVKKMTILIGWAGTAHGWGAAGIIGVTLDAVEVREGDGGGPNVLGRRRDHLYGPRCRGRLGCEWEGSGDWGPGAHIG